MKNKKNILIILIILITPIIAAVFMNNSNDISKQQAEKIYSKNKDLLISIIEYEQKHLYENNEQKKKYYGSLEKQLNKAKIVRVDSNRGDEDIWFVMQENNKEQGIVYIKNDIQPNIEPGMGTCERIDVNWFYYVINRT